MRLRRFCLRIERSYVRLFRILWVRARLEQSGDPFQRSRRFAGYLSARRQYLLDQGKTRSPPFFVLWQQLRNRGHARFGLQQEHKELFTHQRLELRQRQWRSLIALSRPTKRLEASFIDHAPRRADIEQTTDESFSKATIADPGCQLRDAYVEKLPIFWRHLRPWRRIGFRVDAN